jgi:hypothetical protein
MNLSFPRMRESIQDMDPRVHGDDGSVMKRKQK